MADAAPERRFSSISEFWPHYLGEHRVAADRAMHFIGTGWMFCCMAAALVLAPEWMIPALGGMALVGWLASSRIERRRPAFGAMLLMYGFALVG
ncbi:MAG: Mpo1-like protein, partial [Planctomycetota bacterium]